MLRDRSPCSLLGGPPPSSKSESQTRGQVVGPCGNQKSGGFDMLQPMVERKNQCSAMLTSRGRHNPTSACERPMHVCTVLPAQPAVKYESLPTVHNNVVITMTHASANREWHKPVSSANCCAARRRGPTSLGAARHRCSWCWCPPSLHFAFLIAGQFQR